MPLNKLEHLTLSHFCVFSNYNYWILIRSFLLHRNEIHDLSLNIVFDAGPAMSLGFLIHLFLHFVIIASKIAEQPDQPQIQTGCRNLVANNGSIESTIESLSSNDRNENVAWNKRLGNGDYFAIIASSSHPLLLTEYAANGLVEVSLKKIKGMKDLLLCVHDVVWQTTKNGGRVRAARAAARLFFLNQSINNQMFSGVVVAIAVVLAQIRYWIRTTSSKLKSSDLKRHLKKQNSFSGYLFSWVGGGHHVFMSAHPSGRK